MRPNFKNFYDEWHREDVFVFVFVFRGRGEKGHGHQGIREGEEFLRGRKNLTEEDAVPDISATHCLAQVPEEVRVMPLMCLHQIATQTPQVTPRFPPASGLGGSPKLPQYFSLVLS